MFSWTLNMYHIVTRKAPANLISIVSAGPDALEFRYNLANDFATLFSGENLKELIYFDRKYFYIRPDVSDLKFSTIVNCYHICVSYG